MASNSSCSTVKQYLVSSRSVPALAQFTHAFWFVVNEALWTANQGEHMQYKQGYRNITTASACNTFSRTMV